MLKNITELGPREAEFVSLIATKAGKVFSVRDAIEFWKLPQIARNKLSRLEKKGWIARIERGKYLVIPLEAGPQRYWSVNSMLLAAQLAQPACIAYWSAMRFWNWTEQLPRIIYVQTTQRKTTQQKSVMGMRFEIVTVSPSKFFGYSKQWEGETCFFVTDKEKTLIDCAAQPKRCGGIEELSKAVKYALAEINFAKLDEYTLRFKNGAVRKRLGYLFEASGDQSSAEMGKILENWQNQLSAGVVPLLPNGSAKGKIKTRWRLRINTKI